MRRVPRVSRVSKRVTETVYGLEAVVCPGRAGNVVIVGDSTRSVRRAEVLLSSG